jgi:glyoxylate/hydroxypyruvate reductase A
VIGWSRTAKKIKGVQYFYGQNQFNEFLAQSQVLINLLPLTPETQNILNRETFYRLPKGAYIINVARGGHLVEEDLIAAIDDRHLSGACLDVFRIEPLSPTHPFWKHPKITVTPHIASVTNPKSVATQIVDNYQRMKSGEPLLNQVDLEKGY